MSANTPIINVAVAVILREDGRVLLAERPPGKPVPGYWEFPGGKFEPDENSVQALTREIHEEIGVDIESAYPWLTREFAYPDRHVRLHFYRVMSWHGTPHGREGQRVSWEDPHAIRVGPLLPANHKVVAALCLPPLYAITAAEKYGVADFMPRLRQALDRGVRLIQVRERNMDNASRQSFARDVVTLAHAVGATVLVNGDADLAVRSGADGVHLQGAQLKRLKNRPETRLWSASCHDAEELARAAELDADFVVLSQVLSTATHPDVAGMGWERFAELARDYPLPVYALGGMRPELLETAMRHGAHGIALLSGIW
jgi:8-oxo-dGTP diphosphatase